MNREKKAIYSFLAAVILISTCLEAIIILTDNMLPAAILLFVPACTAGACYLGFKLKDETGFLFHKCQMKYIGEALLLPLIYIGIPYVIYWIMHPEAVHFKLNAVFLSTLFVGLIINIVLSLGEEIGWRGFLLPRIYKQIGLEKTLLMTSLLWCVWHYPLLFSGLYMPGTPLWFKVPLFTVVIFSVGVMIGILTIRSKSIWPAAVLHGAHNYYDQMIFTEATTGQDKMYYVSETGIFTVVAAVLLAIYVYYSYKKIETNEVGLSK